MVEDTCLTRTALSAKDNKFAFQPESFYFTRSRIKLKSCAEDPECFKGIPRYFPSTKSTIERYKKACNDGLGTSSIEETNAQYYQQESAKLRQLIQNMQNSNRHLLGEGLSSLNIKEMKQLESRIERGLTRIRSKKHEMLLAEIEYSQKRVMELENESVYLQAKIAEVERLQQVNLNMSGSELSAIQALSCNFFTPIVVEGSTSYSQPEHKILRLG
nr:agamous-like MADS-box protein AGL11 [Quercus suber]